MGTLEHARTLGYVLPRREVSEGACMASLQTMYGRLPGTGARVRAYYGFLGDSNVYPRRQTPVLEVSLAAMWKGSKTEQETSSKPSRPFSRETVSALRIRIGV